MYLCYWHGILVGGEEIKRTYPCESESIARSINRGLKKHSIYVIESRVYEVDNDDDIVYYDSKRPLPIPYNPRKRNFNSSHALLPIIELSILNKYKDLLELKKKLPYNINSYIMEFESINSSILFYKSYKSHIQRYAY